MAFLQHDKRLRAILAISESTAPFPLSEMIVFQQALWSAGIGASSCPTTLRPPSERADCLFSPTAANESQHGAQKLADVWITLTWLDTPEDDEVSTFSSHKPTRGN